MPRGLPEAAPPGEVEGVGPGGEAGRHANDRAAGASRQDVPRGRRHAPSGPADPLPLERASPPRRLVARQTRTHGGGGALETPKDPVAHPRQALDKVLGTPRAMTANDIDAVVAMFKHAARVAVAAGFDGVQIHGAHGFLVSEFLSPHTNRRADDYGGDPWRRLALLRRLVAELREVCPPPLCLSFKLNSADYMATGGLQQDEGLGQVRWLVGCGMVDLVEISGGNAENATSKLHNSFGDKSIERAPERKATTRIREAFFTDFAERVQGLRSEVPIQLSGGESRIDFPTLLTSHES